MIVLVTGTGTGVGKTIATAALVATSADAATVIKPVQTGTDLDEPTDVEVVHALTGCAAEEWISLPEPLAPDTAAARAGVPLPPIAAHANAIRHVAETSDAVIVEGAGGLLVRLDADGGTMLDLALDLAKTHEVAVVVVTAAGLGTLNHTELTVLALRAAGIEPMGLIIGSWPAEPDLASTCNREDLPRVTALPVLAVIPAGAGELARQDFLSQAAQWFL